MGKKILEDEENDIFDISEVADIETDIEEVYFEDSDTKEEEDAAIYEGPIEIVGVRFKVVGKIYYFDPCGMKIEKYTKVIVVTAHGIECGTVVVPNKMVEYSEIVRPLKKVLRTATEEDIAQYRLCREKEKNAFSLCQKKIEERGIDMKLVDVEYTFDGNKILFYFTADGRVDFRELVKDLAAVFRTRIELRQIGVRDKARMLGGLGICGRPSCCSSFLGEFHPVSIKMAKEQGLSLNPTKISGICGRLMCCLKYEQETYEDLIRRTPKIGAVVSTAEGEGVVVESNLITGMLKVMLDRNPGGAAVSVHRAQVRQLHEKRPRAAENAEGSAG